jgi:hypothetical protein
MLCVRRCEPGSVKYWCIGWYRFDWVGKRVEYLAAHEAALLVRLSQCLRVRPEDGSHEKVAPTLNLGAIVFGSRDRLQELICDTWGQDALATARYGRRGFMAQVACLVNKNECKM